MFSPGAGSAKIQIDTNTRSFSVSEYPRIEKLAFGLRKRRPLLAGALIALCINTASAKPAFVQAAAPNYVQGNYATPQNQATF
jgi:hypothetical protein